MKIFNVVLAGLIFLLAAVSAVFSFLLFEKRAQLVDNYDQLGKQLAASAKTLDSGTNTGVAQKVTAKELSLSNSTNLPTALKNFDVLAQGIAAERDALAEALTAIAVTMESKEFAAEDFKDINSYTAKIKQLSEYVSKSKKNHDDALDNIAKIAGKYGIRTDKEDLKAGQFEDVVSKIGKALAAKEKLINDYKKAVAELSRKTGVSIDANSPISGLQKIGTDYTTFRANISNLTTANKRLTTALNSSKESVDKLNKEINTMRKDHQAKVAELNRKIASLHENAGIPQAHRNTYQPIPSGSRKALELVREQNIGKVLVVDEKFGFVTISLGKKTYVVDERVTKGGPRYIDPVIPAGAELTVVRPLPDNKNKTEYISRVKITKLDEYCSIAEASDVHGKPIKVGDMVYFSDDAINAIIKNRK